MLHMEIYMIRWLNPYLMVLSELKKTVASIIDKSKIPVVWISKNK